MGMRRYCLILSLLTLVLAGCGGGDHQNFGSVAGVLFDAQGNIVRGATVFSGHRQTTSTSSGSYILDNVPEGDQLIQAEISQDGNRYIGENVARVQANLRGSSVNISLYRDTLTGSIQGHVTDRQGNLLSGAKVLAVAPNANSSAIAYSDEFGNYFMGSLEAGVTYQVQATGRTFDSDPTTFALSDGQTLTVNFQLNPETNPTFNAPTNLAAVTWTTPGNVTRSLGQGAAYEAIKRLYDKKRPAVATRDSSLGNPIEVDLTWTPIIDVSLLGYGIYRSVGMNNPDTNVTYYRDPLAGYYADSDSALQPNVTYGYDITALNTSYPDTSSSESAHSTKVAAFPLDDLVLNGVTSSPITFNWQPVLNADSYVVYVFSEYPGIGIAPVWSNQNNPTTSTSLVYGGPAVFGHSYFYVVLGLGNSTDSRTISQIDSFIP